MLTLRIICGSNIGVIESFFDWRLQPHLGVVESFLDEQNLRQELDANQEKYMKYACMHHVQAKRIDSDAMKLNPENNPFRMFSSHELDKHPSLAHT